MKLFAWINSAIDLPFMWRLIGLPLAACCALAGLLWVDYMAEPGSKLLLLGGAAATGWFTLTLLWWEYQRKRRNREDQRSLTDVVEALGVQMAHRDTTATNEANQVQKLLAEVCQGLEKLLSTQSESKQRRVSPIAPPPPPNGSQPAAIGTAAATPITTSVEPKVSQCRNCGLETATREIRDESLGEDSTEHYCEACYNMLCTV